MLMSLNCCAVQCSKLVHIKVHKSEPCEYFVLKGRSSFVFFVFALLLLITLTQLTEYSLQKLQDHFWRVETNLLFFVRLCTYLILFHLFRQIKIQRKKILSIVYYLVTSCHEIRVERLCIKNLLWNFCSTLIECYIALRTALNQFALIKNWYICTCLQRALSLY